jgi:hypothetical protein
MAESPQAETLDVGIPGSGATGFSVDASPDPILADEQLRDVLDGVFRLRGHWIERATGFFTRGAEGVPGARARRRGGVGTRAAAARLHVFDATGLRPAEPTGDAHFDIQYVWGRFEAPVLDVVSVTVPIRVPASGTSLEYWPVDYAEFARLYADETIGGVADAERLFPMHQVSYEPGKPCLIRGLPLHRIGTTPRVEPSDYRITLQGHAARLGERWVAYW